MVTQLGVIRKGKQFHVGDPDIPQPEAGIPHK